MAGAGRRKGKQKIGEIRDEIGCWGLTSYCENEMRVRHPLPNLPQHEPGQKRYQGEDQEALKFLQADKQNPTKPQLLQRWPKASFAIPGPLIGPVLSFETG